MKSKVFIGVVSLILVAVLVLSFVLVYVFAVKDFSVSSEKLSENGSLAISDNNEIFNGGPVRDQDGNALFSDRPNVMPKAMTFSSATSLDGDGSQYDTVDLSVSVYPRWAELESVDFTCDWADPSCAWATGKNVADYVTVAEITLDDNTGSHWASYSSYEYRFRLQCKQPFCEQVVISATAVSSSGVTITDSCSVDFAKRILDVRFFGENYSPEGISLSSAEYIPWYGDFYCFDTNPGIYFEVIYSDYSVDDFVGGPSSMMFNIYSASNVVAKTKEYATKSTGISLSGPLTYVFPTAEQPYDLCFYPYLKGGNNSISFSESNFQSYMETTVWRLGIETIDLFAITLDFDGIYSDYSVEVPFFGGNYTSPFVDVTRVTLSASNTIF